MSRRPASALVFATHCGRCHSSAIGSGALVPIAEIGTHPDLATGRARGTGAYRPAPLIRVADAAPYLHHGAIPTFESLLDPAVTGKVLERMRRIAASDEPDELSALTQQERKILALVAEGKTNKEIAAEVFLSDKTVKNYVSSILAKLNLQRRTQAAAFVAKHHIGDAPGS